MKKYTLWDQGDTALTEHESGEYYLASDVDAHITELETRLIACETALLMATAGSVPDTAAYMAQYPQPYSAS